MRNLDGLRRGGPGRRPGTLNRSTAHVKAFLGRVFDEAFASPEMHERLVKQIVSLEIDPKLLGLLLAYYAGRPAVALDHRIEGTLTLAELIVGATPPADDDDDAEELSACPSPARTTAPS